MLGEIRICQPRRKYPFVQQSDKKSISPNFEQALVHYFEFENRGPLSIGKIHIIEYGLYYGRIVTLV